MVSPSTASASLTPTEQIAAAIAPHIAEWFGPDAELVSPRADGHERRWSRAMLLCYRVQTPQGPVGLMVKTSDKPLPYQFEWLDATWRAFQAHDDPRLGAVRPYAYLPQWNAVVMDDVHGRSLKQILVEPSMVVGMRWRWTELERLLWTAGRWLRVYHETVGEPRKIRLPVTELQKQFDAELAEITGGQEPRYLADLRSAFDQALQAVQHEMITTAIVHGDYNCENLLFTDSGRLYAFDPAERGHGAVEYDMARVVAGAITRHAVVFSHGLLVRRAWSGRCASAVAAGYHTDQPNSKGVLYLYCALAIITKWAYNESTLRAHSSTVPVRLTSLFMRRHMLRTTMRFLVACASGSEEY